MSDAINGHVTRDSDSSFYDEVCVNCGATDTNSGLGDLAYACPSPGVPYATTADYYARRAVQTCAAARDPEFPCTCGKHTTRGLFTGEGA